MWGVLFSRALHTRYFHGTQIVLVVRKYFSHAIRKRTAWETPQSSGSLILVKFHSFKRSPSLYFKRRTLGHSGSAQVINVPFTFGRRLNAMRPRNLDPGTYDVQRSVIASVERPICFAVNYTHSKLFLFSCRMYDHASFNAPLCEANIDCLLCCTYHVL